VPLQFDGRLDDWTNDMEDRNVSLFQHATPVVLSSRDATAGTVAGDAELSGIVYFLHDATQLFVAGIVFSKDAAQLEIELAGRKLAIAPASGKFTFEGAPVPKERCAAGRHAARDVTDTGCWR